MRRLIFLIVLSLLILGVLPACGGGEGEETSTFVATNTPIAMPTSTVIPTITTTTEPVKIGVIGPWSGPAGVSGVLTDQIIGMVEDQVKNMGGILGGREVKFYRGDDAGIISQSVAQAKKLVLDNKVSILTLGGISIPGFTAVAEEAEKLKVPYVATATIIGVQNLKYSACANWRDTFVSAPAAFVANVLKPKTVAWLAWDTEESHTELDGAADIVGLREHLKANGISVISEQYVPVDAVDFTPYLTKIKHTNPDLLMSFFNTVGQSITINKQIIELGGWGDIKYFAIGPPSASPSAIKIPSAVGTYVVPTWMQGSDDPGMKAFEDAFLQKYGREPSPELSALYNPIGIALKAIELAGTDDPDKVAQTLRSGNFVWDSAWGPLHITSEGIGEITLTVAQVEEGGKLVKVWPQ